MTLPARVLSYLGKDSVLRHVTVLEAEMSLEGGNTQMVES